MDRLEYAKDMCRIFHKGQVRRYTGEPYHVHPIEVAELLKEAQEPEDVQIAGLLHDVLEDCDVEYSTLALMFGVRVADIVQMVTDVSKPGDGNRQTRKMLDLLHLERADRDGQTVKLADLISNSQSIAAHDPNFAKVYMAEKRAVLGVLTDGNPILYQKAVAILEDYFSGNKPHQKDTGQ